MTLVDSSVWIDFFNGLTTPEVSILKDRLRDPGVMVGDLMVAEVLQGFRHDRDVERAARAFNALPIVPICDPAVAFAAALNSRKLRAAGVTVRKTIDTLIATRCLLEGWALLHHDRDFDAFEEHLGLLVER